VTSHELPVTSQVFVAHVLTVQDIYIPVSVRQIPAETQKSLLPVLALTPDIVKHNVLNAIKSHIVLCFFMIKKL